MIAEYFQLLRDNPDARYEYRDGWVYALAGDDSVELFSVNVSFSISTIYQKTTVPEDDFPMQEPQE